MTRDNPTVKDSPMESRQKAHKTRVAKATRGIVIALAAFTVIVLIFALFFSAPLVQRYGLPAASAALGKSGFHLDAGWVEGRPITGVTFGDFRIIHTGADGDSVTVFRADTLRVEYEPLRLIRKEWRIESVYLANPEITLIRPPEGGILLPGLKGPRKSGRRGSGPTVEIQRIELADGLLTISKEAEDEIFLNMDIACSFVRDPWSVRIGLEHGSFRMPGRNLDVLSTSADLTIKQGVLYMSEGFVQLPTSAISFDGDISFKDKTRYNIDCKGRPYDVPELAAILKQSWPTGVLEGEASVYGPSDSLAISALVDGTVERFTLEALDVDCLRRQSGFSFSAVRGLVNGARVDAEGGIAGGALDFEVDFKGLDASNGFFPGVPFPETDLTGSSHVFHPRGGAPWEVRASMKGGHVAGFEFGSLFFAGDVVSDLVTADSIHVDRADMAAEASGRIGTGHSGEIALEYRTQVDSLDYAARWLSGRELQGSLTATGTLSGPSSDPVLKAAGALGWVGRGPARLDGGAFEATVDGLADPGPIEFRVSGGELSVGGVPLGDLVLSGVYDGGELSVPAFRLERADSSASGAFTLRGSDGVLEADIKRLDFALDGVQWSSGQPFSFTYGSDVYSVQGFRGSSGSGVLALSGRLDRRNEYIELNVAGTGMQMSLFNLTSTGISEGSASGELILRGPLSGPAGSASLSWTGARAFGREVREVALRCDVDGDGISIERLWLDSSSGSCLLSGRVEARLDLPEIVTGGVRDLADRAASSPIDLFCSVSDLDLDWLAQAASLERQLSGTVSVSAEISGSLEDPTLDLELQATGLNASGLTLDSVSGTLEYADGRLLASEAGVTRGEVTAIVDGYLPLSIGLRDGIRILSGNPMALEVKVTAGDFGVLADVWDRLGAASGTFVLDATIAGTPDAPSLSGSGRLEKCAVRLAGMEEQFRNISCQYTLRGERVEIFGITGAQGKNGTFGGFGEVRLAWPGIKDYSFDITFRQMPVLTPMDYDAIVSGELVVTAHPLDRGKLIPKVAGRVVVEGATYIGGIGESAELENAGAPAGTISPRWLADLDVEIPGNLAVSNPNADLLLEGDILLIKDFDGVKPRGDLRVVSGAYYLLNTEFTVTSGTISFGEAVGVNPDLDITAETVLGPDESGIEERIYVHLTGTARDPEIRVSSTSGYSETDIYNMLLAGTLWGQGPQEAGDPNISALATNTLFTAIDARLRDLFGRRPPVTIDLTRRQYTREGAGEAETRISLGRNLSRRLFLRYEQGFSAITAREVNLDYRVNRYLLLRSQIINNPERGIREESGSELNFDIKLRYEF